MYRFSRVAPLSSRSTWGGAAHTSEVAYVFDNTGGDASQFEETDRTVSRAMADAWVQFDKTGIQTVAGCLDGLRNPLA